jgi:hypothetical protein
MAGTRFGLVLGIILWLAAQASFAAIVPPLPQPSWKELTADQQRILAPLSGEWDKMEGFRRKKWLGIAQRYQTLTPDEQSRMQRRMTAWAKLTPEERKRARGSISCTEEGFAGKEGRGKAEVGGLQGASRS